MSEPATKKPRSAAQVAAFQKALAAREASILKKAREREAAERAPPTPPTPAAAEEEDEAMDEEDDAPPTPTTTPVAPAAAITRDDDDDGYTYVDFDPDTFKTNFRQELNTDIDALRQELSSLKSQVQGFGEQHEKLSNDFIQNNISKAHALNFV